MGLKKRELYELPTQNLYNQGLLDSVLWIRIRMDPAKYERADK